jgi:hypothetical protein
MQQMQLRKLRLREAPVRFVGHVHGVFSRTVVPLDWVSHEPTGMCRVQLAWRLESCREAASFRLFKNWVQKR